MAFRECVQEIKGEFKSRMQPVTEWAPELFLSFHLIREAPNRSAGGGNDLFQNISQFEELKCPALRYGGSKISSSIKDAYSVTWISSNNLFFFV